MTVAQMAVGRHQPCVPSLSSGLGHALTRGSPPRPPHAFCRQGEKLRWEAHIHPRLGCLGPKEGPRERKDGHPVRDAK